MVEKHPVFAEHFPHCPWTWDRERKVMMEKVDPDCKVLARQLTDECGGQMSPGICYKLTNSQIHIQDPSLGQRKESRCLTSL